jgi:hypothetical protein
VLPDFLIAITSLPERTKWIKGLLVLHPGSEFLQCLEETIMLALRETGRLTEGIGKLPRDKFSSFRYWFAVQEVRDMEALLEMDEDEYEEGKEKGSTAAAAIDPDVITRCDFVAYGQRMQKTLRRFLPSADSKAVCRRPRKHFLTPPLPSLPSLRTTLKVSCRKSPVTH